MSLDLDTIFTFSITLVVVIIFGIPLLILGQAKNFELPSMEFSYPRLVLLELCFLIHLMLIGLGWPASFVSILLIAVCSYQMIKLQYFIVVKETHEKYRKKSVMKWTGWVNVVLLCLSIVISIIF